MQLQWSETMQKKRALTLLLTISALLGGILLGFWGWTLSASASGSILTANVSSAFAYQGQLRDGGRAADGSYDFTFTLYDALSGGVVVGSPVSKPGVAVEQGFFAVELDFGAVFDGSPRYLELAVRRVGATQVPSILNPRQRIAPVPYALHASQAQAVERWRWINLLGNPGDVQTGQYMGVGSFSFSPSLVQNSIQQSLGAPSDAVTVRDARMRLYYRDISDFGGGGELYNGALRLSFELRKTATGALVQRVDTDINLMTTPFNQWLSIPVIQSLQVGSDEHLICIFSGNGTAGSVNVRFDLEVEVQR